MPGAWRTGAAAIGGGGGGGAEAACCLVVQAPAISAADKAANFKAVEIFIVGISRERKPVPGFRKIKGAPNTSNVLIAKKSQKMTVPVIPEDREKCRGKPVFTIPISPWPAASGQVISARC